MDPTDAELYSMLLEQLSEVGEVIEDRDAGVLHVSGMPDCTHWSLAPHPSRSAAGPARTVPACREGNVSREGLRAAWRRGVPKAFRWPGPPQSGNHPGPACSSGSLRRGRSAV